MIVSRALACVAGAVLMLGLAGSPASAATAVPASRPASLVMAQPSSVCGYSQHALDQMAARGISPFDVRMTVALGAGSAFLNNHGNWQYESGNLIVTMNDGGCVVTAMTR
jgi:hypothetical protein